MPKTGISMSKDRIIFDEKLESVVLMLTVLWDDTDVFKRKWFAGKYKYRKKNQGYKYR